MRAKAVGTTEPLADPLGPAWTIEPRARRWSTLFREVWIYRRLFRYFAARSVERRYRGTYLGAAWLLIRPVFPLAIQTLVYGGILGVSAPGVPYFLFVTMGSSLWGLFSESVMWSMRSLRLHRGSTGRMYFPSVIVPIATLAVAFVHFFIMIGLTLCAMVYYFVTRGEWYLQGPAHLLWAVSAVVLTALLGLAVGLWAAPLNAEYRDVRYTIGYVIGFWSLLTPVLYPLSAVPAKYHWLVFLNPLAGLVQAFKWGMLGIESLNVLAFATDVALIALLLGSGLWYFTRVEGQALDRV